MKCVECGQPATKIDNEYEEGYCEKHFEQWQASTQPIESWRDA